MRGRKGNRAGWCWLSLALALAVVGRYKYIYSRLGIKVATRQHQQKLRMENVNKQSNLKDINCVILSLYCHFFCSTVASFREMISNLLQFARDSLDKEFNTTRPFQSRLSICNLVAAGHLLPLFFWSRKWSAINRLLII